MWRGKGRVAVVPEVLHHQRELASRSQCLIVVHGILDVLRHTPDERAGAQALLTMALASVIFPFANRHVSLLTDAPVISLGAK